MKIKDLPQDLQELALKEAELQNESQTTIETGLLFAFEWSKSTQGHAFWNKIYYGNF